KGRSLEPELFAFVVAEVFAQSPSLLEYEALKQRQGFATTRINVGAGDTPETIRRALQDLYHSSNLQYALLIGDSDTLPAKRGTHIGGVTDHYYRAIDTANYDSDINGPD